MATVSVIIVNWNASDVLPSALRSVLAQTYDPHPEIIVVDNASTDHSLAAIARFAPEVQVIASRVNLGFGRGNNVGARAAAGDILLFLNPDTELLGSYALSKLVTAIQDPSVGLVGPRLVNPDGSVQQSCSAIPSVWSALFVGAGLHFLTPDRWRSRLAPVAWSHSHSADTGWLKGAAVVIRRPVFEELGGWSEATFMYGEDLDLAARVRWLGLRVRFEARVGVIHHDDHSAAQRWSDDDRARLVARGNIEFMREHYSPFKSWVIRVLSGIAMGGRALALSRLHRKRAVIYRAMAETYLRLGRPS